MTLTAPLGQPKKKFTDVVVEDDISIITTMIIFQSSYIDLARICGDIYAPLRGNHYQIRIGQGNHPPLPQKIAIAIAALVLSSRTTPLQIPAHVTHHDKWNHLPHLNAAAIATCGARAPLPTTPTAPAEKQRGNVHIAKLRNVETVHLKTK